MVLPAAHRRPHKATRSHASCLARRAGSCRRPDRQDSFRRELRQPCQRCWFGNPPTRCSTRCPAALQATAVVVAAVQAELDAARAAHAELQLEHSVLAAAAAHQQGSVQVLQLAGLAAAADPDASPAAALPTSGAPTWKETLYAAEEPGVLPGGAAAAALLAHQHMQVEQPAAAVRPHEQSGSGSGDAASSHSTSPEPSSGDGTQRVAPQSSNTRSSSGQESAASAGAGAAAASLAGSAGAAGGGHGANSRSWLEQAMLLQVRHPGGRLPLSTLAHCAPRPRMRSPCHPLATRSRRWTRAGTRLRGRPPGCERWRLRACGCCPTQCWRGGTHPSWCACSSRSRSGTPAQAPVRSWKQ